MQVTTTDVSSAYWTLWPDSFKSLICTMKSSSTRTDPRAAPKWTLYAAEQRPLTFVMSFLFEKNKTINIELLYRVTLKLSH
ncbi:unnamed protein product [Acanthoscelides obtectus]|uniref:Uncharacterized protein n=1 Tax=Acanthoscelides obtectus TaxID=200917 RepID=A0A9P0JWX7_ACAOB|nr:unnamed protein product [Acanthoscelides obtectus]CAK1663358.1 hypothetical protein AOBTE_LOCUS23628 [Acanthoscelides obtectus]